jgi:CRISPR-associated protein Csm2
MSKNPAPKPPLEGWVQDVIGHVPAIIGGDVKLLVEDADKIGEAIKLVSTSQIRNVYGPVRQIELTWPEVSASSDEKDRQKADDAYRKVALLRPKLSYLAARDQKLKPLEAILGKAIQEISDASGVQRRARFQHFVEFFEAILAYHKKYGGK